MNTIIKKISDNFKENVDSVHKLVNFDEIVQMFYLDGLKRAEKGLKKYGAEDHPNYSVKNQIKSISNIRENKSLRPHYEAMLNQCIVLLVSYFASAVEDIFELSLPYRIRNRPLSKLRREEIKITLGDLEQIDFNVLDNIGRIVVAKKQMSFQDMQSIANAFKDYFNFKPEKDKDVNNIILGQACRNSIVHSGGIINDKIIKQISKAKPRDLKGDLKVREKVQFNSGEIDIVATSMTCYINGLITSLHEHL